MSNQRLLAMALVFLTACAAYVMTKLADAILVATGAGNPEVFGGLTLAVLIGVGLAAVLGIVGWMNSKVQDVGQDVAAELRKVTWPTWPEIRAATGAVVVATLVAAVLLGVMDFLGAKVMSEWIPSGIRWAQGLFA
ncbi:preprotein translocase subunit SecE [Vulgatibacter sp.]|uniref:preprotein translocase subunit SecE n=1 Tax=Vulgatibacter sp. TaxID=1971226 RepID=UPI00356A01BC